MQIAVIVWVNCGDSAKMGTVFGVLDKSNPGALPLLSPQGVVPRNVEKGGAALLALSL